MSKTARTAAPRRITPVILAGGAGTRLWPLSRKARPKQMIALSGAQTMLQMTAARVADPRLFNPALLVAGHDLAEAVSAQLEESGTPPGRLIVEPAARNTAPAIALAALCCDPDAMLLVMPSDHLIQNPAAFLTAVSAALPLAEAGWLVTFGVEPTRPETGFGYIRRGEEIVPGIFRAERFIEKPDGATAQAFLAEGGYQWNAGIFLFNATAYLAALAQHAPGIEQAARAAMEAAVEKDNVIHPAAEAFAAANALSIDHAVMEHAAKIAVAPVEMEWSDVGTWQALYAASAKDAHGNALSGDTLALDSADCLLRSDGPLVVAIGVSDLAVIATGDVVLVVPKGDSKRVQEAVSLLGRNRDPRL